MKDYEEFKNYKFSNNQIRFNINFKFDEEKEQILCYNFLLIDSEEEEKKYMEMFSIFNEYRKENFTKDIEEIIKKIETNGLDIFVIITLNKIIYKLGLNDKYCDNEEYKYFSEFAIKIINEININKSLKKLLLLYYDSQNYKILKSKLIKNNNILLYGFLYCVNSLKKEENNNFFSSLLNENCITILKENFIPGNSNLNNNEENPGIYINDKNSFLSKGKRIRNLRDIGYRLLNFIIYNYLFFANILEFISEEDLSKYCLIKDMNCYKIIENNWYLLKDALKEFSIDSIEIFMNLIYKKLSYLLTDCEYFKKSDERNIFEEKVENMIKDCINNYNNYKIKYINKNYEKINFKKEIKLNDNKELNKTYLEFSDNIKLVLNELIPPEKYKEDEYPLFNYFMLTKYPNIIILKNQLQKMDDYISKYPLLTQILLEEPGFKKLKNLPNINEFSNYMINEYSCKISRKKAKEETLKNEISESKLYQNFIESWKEIKEDAIIYKNWEMKTIELPDKLIYFLIDNKETGYGMYIAAAYQSFINWQNKFLKPIIEANEKEGILHYYVHNLKKKINVQEVKKSQVLNLDNIEIENIINKYTKRDIFQKDGSINYLNYNSFIYDFDSIEKELGEKILPGICMFEEDSLIFVSFLYEDNNELFSNFLKKYPQEELKEEERKIIIECLKNNYTNNYQYTPKEFLNSFHLLFFYLNNNIYNPLETINNMLSSMPGYIKISEDCKNFFENKDKEFKINQMMNIFLFIEHLSFGQLCEDLDEEYKKSINTEDKQIIENKLKDLKEKDELSKVIRRFISRYLIENTNIKEEVDKKLIPLLNKSDLWDVDKSKINEIIGILNQRLNNINLTIFQSFEFYNLIGNKDKEIVDNIENIRKKINEDKKQKEDIDEDFEDLENSNIKNKYSMEF